MRHGYTPLKRWRWNGCELRLWDTERVDRFGGCRLAYNFLVDGKLVFSGSDFCSSPMHSVDNLDTVYGLLGFLSLRPGDTDEEYFEGYTKRQRLWCDDPRCEALSCRVANWEERRS